MEPDDLLCSRNARPDQALARATGTSREIDSKQSEGRAGEKYLPVCGRVRRLRAVEDQSASIPPLFQHFHGQAVQKDRPVRPQSMKAPEV